MLLMLNTCRSQEKLLKMKVMQNRMGRLYVEAR